MVNLGIVGTDPLLYELVPSLREKVNIRISGIYSGDEGQTGLYARDIMIQQVLIPETLIMKSDALLVFDDPSRYFDILVRSIQLSKHLYMTGLGSLGLRQIETLIKLAAEAGIVISCIQPSSRHQLLPDLKELVAQPVLIELTIARTMASLEEPGILKSLLEEAVDAMLYINQAGILKMHAHAGGIASSQQDLLHTRMDFSNGCLGVINISLTNSENCFLIRIYQRGNIIEADVYQEKLNLISFDRIRSESEIPLKSSGLKRGANLEEDDIRRFVDLVSSNTGSVNSIESAYSSKIILQRIYDKIQIPVLL